MILESANNKILQEDIEQIVSGLALDELKDCKVFITGSTGLIGSQIVKTLACANRLKKLNITILALVRSEEKAKKVFGELLNRGDVRLVLGDVNQKPEIKDSVDYVIHGASPTSSRYFVTNPVDTIMTAIDGTKNILEFAKEKQV